MKECAILIHTFSACVEMILWDLFFVYLFLDAAYHIDFRLLMLNQSHIPGITLTCSWCIIFFYIAWFGFVEELTLIEQLLLTKLFRWINSLNFQSLWSRSYQRWGRWCLEASCPKAMQPGSGRLRILTAAHYHTELPLMNMSVVDARDFSDDTRPVFIFIVSLCLWQVILVLY